MSIIRNKAVLIATFFACLAAMNASGISADSDQKLKDAFRAGQIRAAQTGAVQDFLRLPPVVNMTKLAQPGPPPQPQRMNTPSGIPAEAKMVGGSPVEGFNDVIKIKFKTTQGIDDFCSGFLFSIDDEISGLAMVLTAAHCTCGQPDSYKFFRGTAVAQENKFFVLASQPSRYADYSCQLAPEDQIGRDLAAMWIKNPKESDNSNPQITTPAPFIATMHQIYQDTATHRLVGVGYGFTDEGTVPKVAYAAFIPIQSFFCASGRFAASDCASFREFVLADPSAGPGQNPADSCGGDSGSPVFWVPPSEMGQDTLPKPESFRFLVGITSRALSGVQHNRGTTCGGGGIYTAVGHPDVIRWLSQQSVIVRTKYNRSDNARVQRQ